jgi:uncharacterized membrane protein YdjX (TVP38/TMEM64 family)
MEGLAMRRLLPLLGLVGLLALIWAMGWHQALSWEGLAARRAALAELVAARPVAAALGYVAVYAAAVAVSIPGAAVIPASGGLLFGIGVGAALAVTGASRGAVGLYLAARTALGPVLARKAGPWLDRLRPGLERDGFHVLLALRLIPLVPFALLNLVCALVGMRLGPFVAATVLGIIPGAVVFASIGAGLGHVLEAGQTPDLSVVVSWPVLGPLLGLAVLAMLPPAWKWWRGRHA